MYVVADPLFDQAEAAVAYVGENEAAGHVIHVASAQDKDEGDNGLIRYSMANLNEVPFIVEADTGRIILSRSLDYELDRRQYHLRIRAADAGQPFHRESEASLMITLQPKNDNAPFFVRWKCQGSAVMRPNTHLMTLSAIDPDEGEEEEATAAQITYKLLNDADYIRKCLDVNLTSGEITVQCGSSEDWPDLKNKTDVDVIHLQVSASDGLLDSQPMTINITLHTGQDEKVDLSSFMDDSASSMKSRIECQNNPLASIHAALMHKSRDNNGRIDTFPHTPAAVLSNRRTPKFSPDLPSILHVDEDMPIGHEVLQLTALDEDYAYSALLRYSLSSEGDYFRLTPQGQLVVARQLDREAAALHSLNITVCDSGDPVKSSSKILPVKVLDKNDNGKLYIIFYLFCLSNIS